MTRWLGDRELQAWVRLIAMTELLPGALEQQLKRDSDLSHFEYYVMAMLSEAPERTLRMTTLAARANATLSRLSHVVTRLEGRGFVERVPCPGDKRATNAVLTEAGWATVVAAAPGHVENVRETVLDALTDEQVDQLSAIAGAILTRLDPDGVMTAPYERARVEE
ncbi:MarR family transcriptional regulator [Actinotalea sp. M2MS4P-6]|uniref:MarR family winged helix-turn-helix transcriptional regulator n=1 Tax=Actinotalea sp. M2MS4P-6 TaxID=2983762 RepID=UPI0021E442C5|nr:MarR family transcriptional regulator [Actinotalea sp. M2MS4P-6]MCV2394504.1 MarR family transcriptional regulator [Actinotalea sp. M2MS4P-6]